MKLRIASFRAGLIALATLPGCMTEPDDTGAVDQAAINAPLPPNLSPALNAKTTVTVGPFGGVTGDVVASGAKGSVLFDVDANQGFFGGFNVLANTVVVRSGASVGHIFGNDITVDGFASQRSLGVDPGALPQVPAGATAHPGTTGITVNANQAKQACAGRYGAISIAAGGTLNLNGGVYEVTRLTLADNAHLEPSEPVVILVTGALTAGTGATIRPSQQALNAMSAGNIRIEVGGAITISDNSQIRAHLLAPNGKLTIGQHANLIGAAWAKSIATGPETFVNGEDAFLAQAAQLPPPCNDNNACTTDACVTSGTIAFCRNTPVAVGTSCADGNSCNGDELCNATGQCQPGSNAAAGTACPDGDLCDGDEQCNGLGSCFAGTPPAVSDGNTCTADACDAQTGVSHIPLPDGTACSGVGVCQAGVCSVQGAVFSQDFPAFQSAPAQCDAWNDYIDNQLVNGSYSRVSLSGSLDPTGVTCGDPNAATQLCTALHNHVFAQVFCDGRTWSVGGCGGMEITTDSFVCTCTPFNSHDVRPCTGFQWGGMQSDTCAPPSQNLTVVCE